MPFWVLITMFYYPDNITFHSDVSTMDGWSLYKSFPACVEKLKDDSTAWTIYGGDELRVVKDFAPSYYEVVGNGPSGSEVQYRCIMVVLED